MPDQREKILSIVRMKGPLLPNVIAKELNTNILFASAMLSELVDAKQLKLSSLKVGGSPLYFLPQQASRLIEHAKYLPEKERRSFDLLKEKKVLRDGVQEPLTRATLRQIKDFAVPLDVTVNNQREIFWKWYLLSDKEAEEFIKKELGIKTKELQPIPQPVQVVPPKLIPSQKKEIQRSLPTTREEPLPEDKFFRQLKKYFDENSIKILQHTIIRKNTDIDFIVEIPSTVGRLQYFCKAKSKKKISDGDLSSAYLQSQKKHLPILFLTDGELTKKAQKMAESELKNMTVRTI